MIDRFWARRVFNERNTETMLAPTAAHDDTERRAMEHRRSRTALILVDGFAGVTALIGMAMLLTSWPFRLPLSSLQRTPFGDYTVPALILGIVVGGSALLAMGATIGRASLGPILALVAGAIMIDWIVGEMTLLPTNLFTDFATGWLQGVYLLVGLAMVVLALRVTPGGWRGMLPYRRDSAHRDSSPSSASSPARSRGRRA